jgi:triacylglycerol lipase
MLVHGAGFRDNKYLNYWGRIPAALENNGATIFYGQQDSWGSIEYNAGILKDNLNNFLSMANIDKVNIIAHSKGGLEARYMISSLYMADKVASLTTVATPHHGSKTMDLLCKFPKKLHRLAAFFTNIFFRLLGDKEPDFFTASRQFSTDYMKLFNEQNPDAPLIYYQSYAAVLKSALSDLSFFFPYLIIFFIEGKNDGLVTPKSAAWTNFREVLHGATRRGISHADEVDFRRMNFTKKTTTNGISDIRDLYIDIVSGLKQKGL